MSAVLWKWFWCLLPVLVIAALVIYDYREPTYRITQEYRADWDQERFHVYKKIGMPPLTLYALEAPSYPTLEEARESVRKRQQHPERVVE